MFAKRGGTFYFMILRGNPLEYHKIHLKVIEFIVIKNSFSNVKVLLNNEKPKNYLNIEK